MKKTYLFLFLCFIMIGFTQSEVYAKYNTGHSGFEEIDFLDDSAILLVNINEQMKYDYMSKISRGFIGWKVKTMLHSASAEYIGKTIFSRYNNTDQTIDFNYSSSIKNTEETSVVTEGSLTGSISGKGKAISGGLEAEIRKKIGNISTITITEESSFKVQIKPGRKVSLIVKGDAKVSNGVAKYYFLGICFKKGSWEIIDVMSEYYELHEEII